MVPSGDAEQGQWASASCHLCDHVVSFLCDALQVMYIKYIFEQNIFNLMMDLPRLIIEKFDCLRFLLTDGNY